MSDAAKVELRLRPTAPSLMLPQDFTLSASLLPVFPAGPGVQDAPRGPPPEADGPAGPQTPLDHPAGQAPQQPAAAPRPQAGQGQT